MSATMATDDLVRQYHIDETSCGPLCQHPQCWASNRRTERGLPRLKDPLQTSWDPTENEGALPTLKVQNLLADSGLAGRDSYPAPRSMHHRSSSASAVDFDNRARSTSAQSMPASLPGHRPSKAKSVEVRELFEVDELNSDWQRAFVPSHVYVWCPSKRAYERQLRRERDQTPEEINEQSDAPKQVTVKDMTDLMVPKAPKDKTKRTKKMKKKPSRITPTGGRPYTHPSRSPQVHRKTRPVDVDESISQLLTLPRDILMDVLVHIQNSDSLDKEKVHLLLSQLMPLIHFDQNQPLHRALSPTPLLASGILQNKKMSLLQGRPRPTQRESGAHQKNPFYLDDSLVSAMTTSTYTALAQQLPAEEGTMAIEQSGRMARQQPLGPINADQNAAEMPQGQHIRNKLTSVSTKSLPPLAPGSKPTKPFDYKGAKSLDLTLGPLPSPGSLSPEKPSTPHSEKASTLYVTLPSVLTLDRTEMSTPLQPYGRVSAHGYAERFASQFLRDTPSPIASENFHPLHAVSPSLSTGVPQAPLGTPATNIQRPFKPVSASHQRLGRSPSPTIQAGGTPQRETNTTSGLAANPSNGDALGTICEARSELTTSHPGTSAMDASFLTSPRKHGVTPISTPWGNCTTVTTAGMSDRASRSPVQPVTPQPSMATPEPWPVVDERDFMVSPEKPREIGPSHEVSMATPLAPPPSPEPQELKNEFEFAVNDMSKSVVTSLTPLFEEGEEEEEEEDEREEEGDSDDEETFEDDAVREEPPENRKYESEGRTETEDIKPNISDHILQSSAGELPTSENDNQNFGAAPEGDRVTHNLDQDPSSEMPGEIAESVPQETALVKPQASAPEMSKEATPEMPQQTTPQLPVQTVPEMIRETAPEMPDRSTLHSLSAVVDTMEPAGAAHETLASHLVEELKPETQDSIQDDASADAETVPTAESPRPKESPQDDSADEGAHNTSAPPTEEIGLDEESNIERNTVENQEGFDEPVIPAANVITDENVDTINAPAIIEPSVDPNGAINEEQINNRADNQTASAAINEDEPYQNVKINNQGTSSELEGTKDAFTREDPTGRIQGQIADLDISN